MENGQSQSRYIILQFWQPAESKSALSLKAHVNKGRSHYLSLTKLWIPSFSAAILREIATTRAGKPAIINKNMCLEHDSSGLSEQSLPYRHKTHSVRSVHTGKNTPTTSFVFRVFKGQSHVTVLNSFNSCYIEGHSGQKCNMHFIGSYPYSTGSYFHSIVSYLSSIRS